jgi:pimeloyl-ACP methyl ester carboxylesterase
MMKRPDRTHVLKNSTVPILFVIGTEDVAAPLNDVLKQVHLSEISYIHILENTGHMGMWESADILNEYLEEFVNESD